MLLDLEDLWLSAKLLVGLQFANVEDFDRCRELAWKHPDSFCMMDQAAMMIEVRKTDVHLVDQAGIPYTVVELHDLDELPTEERLRLEREMVREGMAILLERLRREE